MNGTEVIKPTASPEQVEKLKGDITVQGDKVRNLKTGGAAKVWFLFVLLLLFFVLKCLPVSGFWDFISTFKLKYKMYINDNIYIFISIIIISIKNILLLLLLLLLIIDYY